MATNGTHPAAGYPARYRPIGARPIEGSPRHRRSFTDALDRRILESLQVDAGSTNRALAERVGLSPSACPARVERLRASGTIDRVAAAPYADA